MKRWNPLLPLAAAVLFSLAPSLAPATDVDGPNDCLRDIHDYGDAPEAIPAYPSGVLGHFPTCVAPSAPGTQEIACTPPLSTPPGPTGFVHHLQVAGTPGNYWLGCYVNAIGPFGIDSEPDGKVHTPATGFSACLASLATDCVESFFPGMTFDQDECYSDGSDAGVTAPPSLSICSPATVRYFTSNCGTQRQVFLNLLIDENGDGDWNDNFQCPGACAYEWAVKNAPVTLGPTCETHVTPSFLVGPTAGFGWMRISLSDTPMTDDYPWAGTVGMPGNLVRGGETEDYPVLIQGPTPTQSSTWGRIKTLYR